MGKKKVTNKAPAVKEPTTRKTTQNFSCGQRGCKFKAKERPKFCPVCNNPLI